MFRTAKFRWSAGAWLAFAALAHGQQASTPLPQKVDQVIAVAVVPGQMKFDVESFTAKPGSSIRITLTNKDVMQHNLVICKPGADTGMKVAQKAWALGSEALAKQYIPDSPDVLFHTRLVDPSGQDSFDFKAPAAEGDYPYVCTMPGHAMTMKGVMHISRTGARKKAPDVVSATSYRIYPGAASLEAIAGMKPAKSGTWAGGLLSMDPVKAQPKPFAFVIDATFPVALAGVYTFQLGSTSADLSVDGKTVVAANQASNEGKAELKAGPHALELRFWCNEDDPWCELSMRPPGKLISDRILAPLPRRIILNPAATPLVERISLPDCSPEAVAVGFPGGSNYCFDPMQCAVRYGWTGSFLDVAPNLVDRGGKPSQILGQRFDLGPGTCPLRINGNDNPVVKFLGYRMGAAPQMFFSVDGQLVVQTVTPETAPDLAHGFAYRFEFPGLRAPVRFLAPAGPARVSSKAGAFENGVLALPPDKAAAGFSVTIFPAK